MRKIRILSSAGVVATVAAISASLAPAASADTASTNVGSVLVCLNAGFDHCVSLPEGSKVTDVSKAFGSVWQDGISSIRNTTRLYYCFYVDNNFIGDVYVLPPNTENGNLIWGEFQDSISSFRPC
jgi:hypothetical protein